VAAEQLESGRWIIHADAALLEQLGSAAKNP
jgi:hypothetical protein